jgi:hypothetical protein
MSYFVLHSPDRLTTLEHFEIVKHRTQGTNDTFRLVVASAMALSQPVVVIGENCMVYLCEVTHNASEGGKLVLTGTVVERHAIDREDRAETQRLMDLAREP